MKAEIRVEKGIDLLSLIVSDLQKGGESFFENRNAIGSVFFKDKQLHEDFVEIVPSEHIGSVAGYLWRMHMTSGFSKDECKKYISDVTFIQDILKKGYRQLKEGNEQLMENKIFISHSSKDINYVKSIVEMLEDIGLRKNHIFCSSFPEYGIPAGQDIYKYLKKQFNDYNLKIIFVLSKNYYESVASLNEMGAAWILKKDALSILVPGFSIDEIKGCVNKNEIAIR